jgi:hypothetical protein
MKTCCLRRIEKGEPFGPLAPHAWLVKICRKVLVCLCKQPKIQFAKGKESVVHVSIVVTPFL